LQRERGNAARGQDDVRCERDQFRRIYLRPRSVSPAGQRRCARCGRRSSLIAAGPLGARRCVPVLSGRSRPGSSARRCAACDRPAARFAEFAQ
jgi:hypothetical protein